jgi:hypothetical protein
MCADRDTKRFVHLWRKFMACLIVNSDLCFKTILMHHARCKIYYFNHGTIVGTLAEIKTEKMKENMQ